MIDSRPSVIRPGAQVRADIDAGLRAYMNRVYMLMAVAMVVSGALAYLFGSDLRALMSGQETIMPTGLVTSLFTSPMIYVLMFAPLGLVMLLGFRIHKMSASSAQATFFVYAGLVGVSLATIFVRFTDASIVQTFLVTAVAFMGLSIYGYTTKKDLSGMGRFLTMALIGLIVVAIVNMFVESSGLQIVISAVGVLIFAGLTAYDTQAIKNEYLAMAEAGPEGQAYMEKGAIMGALRLYLDFLNMFLFLLQFLGSSND